MYSRSRSASTWPRISRAYQGHQSTASASMVCARLGPRIGGDGDRQHQHRQGQEDIGECASAARRSSRRRSQRPAPAWCRRRRRSPPPPASPPARCWPRQSTRLKISRPTSSVPKRCCGEGAQEGGCRSRQWWDRMGRQQMRPSSATDQHAEHQQRAQHVDRTAPEEARARRKRARAPAAAPFPPRARPGRPAHLLLALHRHVVCLIAPSAEADARIGDQVADIDQQVARAHTGRRSPRSPRARGCSPPRPPTAPGRARHRARRRRSPPG